MSNRALVLAALLLAAACPRETRDIKPAASAAGRANPVRVSGLQPGPTMLGNAPISNPYEGNAYAIGQGQQLFEQYNCSGCHFHGGGGIGPPLMDEEWIYGSSPAQIFESIKEGRPNGMPSWGGHIPDYQIWQLVSYVRSVGGFESRIVTPSRGDEMQARRAEEPRP